MRKKQGKRQRKRARPKRRASPTRNQIEVLGRLKQDAAAWALGVSARTLRESVDAPRLADGRYDMRVLLAWWVEREKRKLPAGPSPARERILEAQAAAAERRNAIESGKLIDIESVAHTVRWIFAAFSSRLEALAKASTPDQASALDAALEQARQQLVAAFPAIAADEASAPLTLFDGGPGAAAQ